MNAGSRTEWFDAADPTGRTSTGEVGLRFACTSCGACCTGAPGFVLFTRAEGRKLADRLGLSDAEFNSQYTHNTPRGRSLTEMQTEHGHDCVFLDRNTVPGKAICGVYEDRPEQCRTWPFWKSNLRDRKTWDRAGRGCPGIDTGPLYEPAAVRLTRDRVDI